MEYTINLIWQTFSVKFFLQFNLKSNTCLHDQFKLKKSRRVFLFTMDNQRVRVASACLILVMLSKKQKKRKRRQRCEWVKPWLRRRRELGTYDTLLEEFRVEDQFEYQKFLRMSPEIFNELLEKVEPLITKENTVMRDAIPAKVKLAATLRYLATGASHSDLQYSFRIHKSTISRFIPEVCYAIYETLKDTHLKVINSFISYYKV